MASTPTTTTELLDLVRRSGILPEQKLNDQLGREDKLPPEASRSAAVLVKSGVLTSFQAKLLLSGRYRGFRLGPYIIQEQIGQGGMGAVYRASHETLNRDVAIKVLPATDAQNRVTLERFLREARSAAALDHPNIVRLHDVGKQGDTHYLVMELVDGQTLDRVVTVGGPIACGRAVDYIVQAAAGLQHAHEKGFVHRDIKPGNLILSRDGTVKLLDMGLARSFDDQDKLTERLDEGAVVGTADYISPEQAINAPDLDIRADIYSLGATFYTLVAGRPPFEGTTTQKLMQHQIKMPKSITEQDRTFPPGLSAVVDKMLAKKPAERYQTPAEVIAALTPWLSDSAPVLNAISRTNMKRAPELRDTLNEVVTAGTKRLDRNPAQKAETTNLPIQKPRKLWPFVAGGVALLAIVGIGVGVMLAGGSSKQESTTQAERPVTPPATTTPSPAPDPSPAPAPKPAPKPTPAVEVRSAPSLLYQLDLANAQPFSERGHMVSDPANPSGSKWVTEEKTGEGRLPSGWVIQSWSPQTVAESAIAVIDGSPAISIRNRQGPGSTMLFSPEIPASATTWRVRVEYRTEGNAGRFSLRYRPAFPVFKAATDVGALPLTNGQWRVQQVEVDLKGTAGGAIEFHNSSADPSPLMIRSFSIQEVLPNVGNVLARLDLDAQAPFVQRATRNPSPNGSDPLILKAELGAGRLPTGWTRGIDKPETTGEFFAEPTAVGMAIGMRLIEGPGAILLGSPEVTAPSGRMRVRVLYQSNGNTVGPTVRFKPTQGSKAAAWDVAKLPATGGSWRAQNIDIDLRGSTIGVVEFVTPTVAASPVRIREASLIELPKIASGTNEITAERPFRLDFANQPDFRVVMEQRTLTTGDRPRLPAGVNYQCWKAKGMGEFRCETVDGVKVLSQTNLNDSKSAQFGFELEREMNLRLQPGTPYVIRIAYRTKNQGVGQAAIQDYSFKTLATAQLNPSTTGWQTAEFRVTRQPEVPVRLTIDNHAVGEGNTVYIREIEIRPAK